MTTHAPFERAQPFLLPPDLKDWLPADGIAHFMLAAERVRLGRSAPIRRPAANRNTIRG
jgi:hypothetical protein